MHRTGQVGLTRAACIRIASLLSVGAIVGVLLLLVLPGKPTPTAAGLRQIPRSALPGLKTRLGIDRRPYPSEGFVLTGSLTGALVLSHTPNTLRVEIGTEYAATDTKRGM